jgi:hypothetical protein
MSFVCHSPNQLVPAYRPSQLRLFLLGSVSPLVGNCSEFLRKGTKNNNICNAFISTIFSYVFDVIFIFSSCQTEHVLAGRSSLLQLNIFSLGIKILAPKNQKINLEGLWQSCDCLNRIIHL